MPSGIAGYISIMTNSELTVPEEPEPFPLGPDDPEPEVPKPNEQSRIYPVNFAARD